MKRVEAAKNAVFECESLSKFGNSRQIPDKKGAVLGILWRNIAKIRQMVWCAADMKKPA